jgi:hypothetical protein
MNKAGKVCSIAAALLLAAASTARADGTFITGNYCGGDNFSTCASVTASNVGNVVQLTVTNTSGSASSFFTNIGLGNLGAGVTVTNFSTDMPARFELGTTGLSGAGIITPVVGASVFPPDPNSKALMNGETVTFYFTLGGTYDLANAQFIVHDQGGTDPNCASSTKLVVSGGVANTALCGTNTTTPEPVTMTLLATGLAGMGGVGLRRRNKKV